MYDARTLLARRPCLPPRRPGTILPSPARAGDACDTDGTCALHWPDETTDPVNDTWGPSCDTAAPPTTCPPPRRGCEAGCGVRVAPVRYGRRRYS